VDVAQGTDPLQPRSPPAFLLTCDDPEAAIALQPQQPLAFGDPLFRPGEK